MHINFYTYFHTRNDANAIFYVGKGKGNRCDSIHGRNRYWKNIVAKHGYKIHIASYWSTEQEAFAHEKFLIKHFRKLGFALCNQTDGGEGSSGLICSKETRLKMSAAGKENSRSPEKRERSRKIMLGNTYRLGVVHTAEVRAQISTKMKVIMKGNRNGEGNKGRFVSEETCAKLRIAAKIRAASGYKPPGMAGRIHGEETKAKMSKAHLGNQTAKGYKCTPEQLAKRRASQSARRAREKELAAQTA